MKKIKPNNVMLPHVTSNHLDGILLKDLMICLDNIETHLRLKHGLVWLPEFNEYRNPENPEMPGWK